MQALAAELRTDAEVVHNAPMTVELVNSIYAARATIETRVLEA